MAASAASTVRGSVAMGYAWRVLSYNPPNEGEGGRCAP